jgi:hypothetical protein
MAPATQIGVSTTPMRISWNGTRVNRTSSALFSASAPAIVSCGKPWVIW